MGTTAFNKENTRFYGLRFNIRTDADIIEHVEKQPNKQSYFKALIRADIASRAGDAKESAEQQKEES